MLFTYINLRFLSKNICIELKRNAMVEMRHTAIHVMQAYHKKNK